MFARFKITSLRSLIKTVLSSDLLWIYCYNLHRNVSSLLKVSRTKSLTTDSMELQDTVERTVTISTKVFMPKPSRNTSSSNCPSMLSVEIHR